MTVQIIENHPTTEITIKCPKATSEINQLALLLQSHGQTLPCTIDNTTHLVHRHDILYVESVDKRCFICTAHDVYETALKLYQTEELLDDGLFFRSSKSQVINLKKIKSLCPEFGGRIEAVLENGERLIVSRQYAKSLKERLGIR